MQNLPDEARVIEALRGSLTTHAIYIFPGMQKETPGMTDREKDAIMTDWTERYRRGPTGMLIYNPRGGDPIMTVQMIMGFILNILTAMVAAWILVRSTAITAPFLARVTFIGVLGVLIAFSSHLMYWNWFGFPLGYTTAVIGESLIGWLLAGIGIAAVMKKPVPAQQQ
jgi:hypothetical protein